MGSGHFKTCVIFSGLQISNRQQQCGGHLRFAPTTAPIFFERRGAEGEKWGWWKMTGGDVREVSTGDYYRSWGSRHRTWWGSRLIYGVGGLPKNGPRLWELRTLCVYHQVGRWAGDFPGLYLLSHMLRVHHLLPSLEKQEAKTVSIGEGGSCYEGRCSILIGTGRLCPYRKGNYSRFTDTENNPKYTIRYSEHFRT